MRCAEPVPAAATTTRQRSRKLERRAGPSAERLERDETGLASIVPADTLPADTSPSDTSPSDTDPSKRADGRPTEAGRIDRLVKLVESQESALGERAVCRRLRNGPEFEGGVGAGRGADPRRGQELLGGAVKILGPAGEALGFEGDDARSAWQQLREGLEVVDQDGQQRLHALHHLACGEAPQQVGCGG
jgi:hypothetical protein